MKVFLSIVMFATVMWSCSDQSLEQVASQTKGDLKGSNTTEQDVEIIPLRPYRIYLNQTHNNTGPLYLSSSIYPDGRRHLHLDRLEIGNSEQIWYFERIQNSFYIRPYEYRGQDVYAGRTYLREDGVVMPPPIRFIFTDMLWDLVPVSGSNNQLFIRSRTIGHHILSYLRAAENWESPYYNRVNATDFQANNIDYYWTLVPLP